MDFLSFTLQWIDFLAWPLLALGYPLYASIRAIETGSKYHMKKLVTYWTIFSFISLFEKLIEWVPLWPHMKLITICWLVIPQFNGACYVYENLIHPCLLHQINLQTAANWFNKPMEDPSPSVKNQTFLSVAEKYLEENGSGALQKLIANKFVPKSMDENLVETEEKTRMGLPSATAEETNKLPETIKLEGEWTCKKCQVTTSSENDLKCHYRGRKHREKCEELKTLKRTAKAERHHKENVEAGASTGTHGKQKQLKNAAAATHTSNLWCSLCHVWCPNDIAMAAHLNANMHSSKLQEAMSGTWGLNYDANMPF